MGGLKQTDAWRRLQEHHDQNVSLSIPTLFANDPSRVDGFSMQIADWYIDYSKHRVTDVTMDLLFSLARQRGVEELRDAMFAGEKINTTEARSVLHVALRNPADSHVTVDGEDIMPHIKHVKARMGAFVEAVHSGSWTGFTGKPIKNIVNIGIGGSDLGPRMAVAALDAFHTNDIIIRFDSNIDSVNFYEEVMSDLDPEETLFVVASKTFTTDETMTNALTARLWIEQAMSDKAIDNHFVAVSSNREKVKAFGISDSSMFEMWDWVGGRYSLPSSVGLSLMLCIGSARFEQFLNGYHTIDEHFRTAPLEENAPIILALLSVWYVNFWGTTSELLAPYSQDLEYFPAYVQQLSMESNGKRVTKDGEFVDYPTAPVVWGQPGTNAQHSYFQMLHQGPATIPVDFIGFQESNHPQGDHQKKLLGNMIAQSRALAFGLDQDELRQAGVPENLIPHKVIPGNRPNTTLFAQKLTPESLGQLVALYEHKTFVQGAIWGVNSFDQWGVELGKQLVNEIYPELRARKTKGGYDSSTRA